VKIIGLLLNVAIALGQQASWETHMREGDNAEWAGNYKDARGAYQLALRDEEEPSDSGFRRAAALNNVALMNCKLGFYSEARRQYRQALQWLAESRGPGSPAYASSLHNLAALEFQEGRIDAAIREFHRALQIREGVLGENDPATAQTLSSVSAVYVAQGKYEDAERLCKRALTIEERVLRPDDLQLSATLDTLASIYSRRGQFEAALDVGRRAEQIARNALGVPNPITWARGNKVAVLLADLDRLPEADSLLRQLIEIQETGEENRYSAMTLANLAAVSFRRGSPAESVTLYDRALLILARSGSDDDQLVSVWSNYAWVLRRTGRKRDAKKLEARARSVLVNRQNDWTAYTVDVGDLLPVRSTGARKEHRSR
jgi:tetratricopeptide (TPR) repeat protein